MPTLIRAIGTFLVALSIGSIGGVLFCLLVLTGKLRVHGYWKLWQSARAGGRLIVSNHPSLIETFLLPVTLWPWGVLYQQRFFLWSVPDKKLFPWYLKWLYPFSHCITIDRESPGGAKESIREMHEVLAKKGNITVHPEEGRTDSTNRKSGEAPELKHKHGRTMRKLHSRIYRIAAKMHAPMVPVWVDIPFREEANGFLSTFKRWILGNGVVTFYIGDEFHISENDQDEANHILRHHIMAAGI